MKRAPDRRTVLLTAGAAAVAAAAWPAAAQSTDIAAPSHSRAARNPRRPARDLSRGPGHRGQVRTVAYAEPASTATADQRRSTSPCPRLRARRRRRRCRSSRAWSARMAGCWRGAAPVRGGFARLLSRSMW